MASAAPVDTHRAALPGWAGGLAGIAAVVLTFLGVLLASVGAEPSDPASEAAQILSEEQLSIEAGGWVLLVAAALFPFFVGLVHHTMRRTSPEGDWLAIVAVVGGALTAAGLALLGALSLAAGEVANYGEDVEVARTLVVLGWNSLDVTWPGLATLAASVGVHGWRHQSFGRLVAAPGLLLAPALLVPVLSQLAFLVALGWLAVVALALGWRNQPAT